jgi:putative membrane protein
LSSTSSSAEQGIPKRSATEVLASRYRHLFVLPSTTFLLFYSAIVTFFLAVASRGTFGIFAFVPALAVFVFSVTATSSALQITDRKTIATFRRTSAVLLAGEVLWLLCAACGIVYTWATGSVYAMSNAIVFGAFMCAGLEFLVVNGAFTGSTPLALVLAAIYPASTLAVVRFTELANHLDMLAVFFGAAAFVVIAGFPLMLRRRRTSRGYDSLRLFRSFMKTWAGGEPADLEAIISDHSEEAQVTTKVLRFRTGAGDTFLILPGVHPGPFHPIGSYDLPGVISRAFEGLGKVMTLHRPGGHEQNIATSGDTLKFAEQVSEFARTIDLGGEALLRGPLQASIGKASVSSTAFSDDLILTISFAPLGSDDLPAGVEDELAGPGLEAGFHTYVVDAHNSIDSEQNSPDTSAPEWKELFAKTKQEKGAKFNIAYSHSAEFNFPSAGDLTENGIGLVMLEADRVKSALVLADANNSVPDLKGRVATALESSGYKLIEFCTSDSHNLAARGLTVARGYQALGEETRVDSIVKLVVDLAKLAETRLSQSAYGSGQLTTKVRVFGSKALEEFAALTQSSSRLGRYYLRFASATAGALLILSLYL